MATTDTDIRRWQLERELDDALLVATSPHGVYHASERSAAADRAAAIRAQLEQL